MANEAALGLEMTGEGAPFDIRVVLVDDDPLVTRSLSAYLSLEMEIAPVSFNAPKQALAYIEANEVDVLITDFLMPEMDGIELLEAVRRVRPEVQRVLLTGYADKENAIKAINEVRLFRYLEKPWDNERLRGVVVEGAQRLSLLRRVIAELETLAAGNQDFVDIRKSLIQSFA